MFELRDSHFSVASVLVFLIIFISTLSCLVLTSIVLLVFDKTEKWLNILQIFNADEAYHPLDDVKLIWFIIASHKCTLFFCSWLFIIASFTAIKFKHLMSRFSMALSGLVIFILLIFMIRAIILIQAKEDKNTEANKYFNSMLLKNSKSSDFKQYFSDFMKRHKCCSEFQNDLITTCNNATEEICLPVKTIEPYVKVYNISITTFVIISAIVMLTLIFYNKIKNFIVARFHQRNVKNIEQMNTNLDLGLKGLNRNRLMNQNSNDKWKHAIKHGGSTIYSNDSNGNRMSITTSSSSDTNSDSQDSESSIDYTRKNNDTTDVDNRGRMRKLNLKTKFFSSDEDMDQNQRDYYYETSLKNELDEIKKKYPFSSTKLESQLGSRYGHYDTTDRKLPIAEVHNLDLDKKHYSSSEVDEDAIKKYSYPGNEDNGIDSEVVVDRKREKNNVRYKKHKY